MLLEYKNKKSVNDIINNTQQVDFNLDFKLGNNYLIHGDNLSILKTLLFKYNVKVDLIYIDPPFSTNNIFRIGKNRANTISFNKEDEIAYSDKLKGEDFIEFLRERLILAKEILSDNGSIYLHID